MYRVDRSAFTDGCANENADMEVPNMDEKAANFRCDQTALASDQTAQGVSKLSTSVTELPSFPGTDTEDTILDTIKIESVCIIMPNRKEPDRPYLNSLSSIEEERPIQSSQKINPCKSYEDVMPGVLPEVQMQVEIYRARRKAGTLITTVHPDDLPYDVIVDPVRALWEENELQISPITGEPVDLSSFEEQIDLAMYELEDRMDFITASKKDIAGFRQLFRDYPDLTIQMIEAMLDHQCEGSQCVENDCKSKAAKFKYDEYYWAKRTGTLGSFVKYFKKLFIETHYSDVECFWAKGKPVRYWEPDECRIEPYKSICADTVASDLENTRIEEEIQAEKSQAIR